MGMSAGLLPVSSCRLCEHAPERTILIIGMLSFSLIFVLHYPLPFFFLLIFGGTSIIFLLSSHLISHHDTSHDTLHGYVLASNIKLNLLVDAGAEKDCYASDITRTFPISGKFSPESRAIYEIVLRMQKEAIESLKKELELVYIMSQFKNPEYPQEPKCPHNQQRLCTGIK